MHTLYRRELLNCVNLVRRQMHLKKNGEDKDKCEEFRIREWLAAGVEEAA
jgi:hypothetical protein